MILNKIKNLSKPDLYKMIESNGRLIGYARVSTLEQNLDLQMDALIADHPKVIAAKRMHQDKPISIDEICNALEISRPSLYRYLGM
jgi:DNA invertase Pin-like site-specific DNA recombinase